MGGLGGSSKKSAPTPRTPVEAPNTLQSRATGRVLFAIGEGPLDGLIGGFNLGPQNIFLNETPLMNPDGTFNFEGVLWDFRHGLPNQDYIPGFASVQATHSGDVGLPVEVRFSTPAIRSVTNVNANAVRIIVGLNGLVDQDTKTGDVNGSTVDFVIRVRRQGIPGWEQEYRQQITGKTTSSYERAYRLPLSGEGPWDIQVQRLTPDSDRATLTNGLNWNAFVDIIDRQLTYPNTALLALTFNAETFGNSIPTVTSKWFGWIVKVPSNYNPADRSYTGVWDGTWKPSYTSNPAYLLYALLTHRSGCNLPDAQVDKAALYTCGRYCDELVPSGRKNADGSDIMEPRFEAHFVINTRQEAYAVINSLCSTFRAMAFWAAGAITVVQDAPRDPVVTVNATQTIGGFEFAGPALRAIKTVAMVSFLDAEDHDKPDIEVYEDSELVKKYGWNPESITAFACKSRGQAHRLGKWFIETNKLGDALTYKTSIDHIKAAPGDVIVVTDKNFAGVRHGGRVVDANRSAVRIDQPVLLETGKSYELYCTMPDGTVERKPVFPRPGTSDLLAMADAFSQAPLPESSWVLSASDVAPRQFRIMGIADDGDLQYSVAAVPYDPNIYARVERNVDIPSPPVARLPNPGVVQPPSNVRVERQYISTAGGFTTALELSWDASPDAYVTGYVVRYRRNDGNFTQLPDVQGSTVTIYGETAGSFVFHVQAKNIAQVYSRPAILEIFIPDNSPITLIRPSGLELEGQGNNTTFTGRDPIFAWRGTAVRGSYDIGQEPAVGAGYLDDIFRDYEVRVYSTAGLLLFTDHTPTPRYQFFFAQNVQTQGGPHRRFSFEVRMRDRWGNYSLPAALAVQNPPPDQVTNLALTPGVGSLFVTFDRPADLDFAGTLIWMSTTSGFPTNESTVVYDGSETFIFLQANPNSVQFVRVAAYDSFGKQDLNVSAEIRVQIAGVSQVDFVPPTPPTGLVLTDESSVAPDGTSRYKLIATWNANPEGDLLNYFVEIAEGADGNFLHYETNTTRYEWDVQAGLTYRVRLAAQDRIFNASIFTFEASHTVGGDDSPPLRPVDLRAHSAFKTIWLEWSPVYSPDHSHMEIWEASVNDRNQAFRIAFHPGTSYARELLPAGTTWYYWIQAVDRSGNVSGFFPESATAGVQGRTRKIEEADYAELSIGNAAIANAAIDDAKIANISAGKILANSILSGDIIVSSTGKTLGATSAAITDPATAINLGSTNILPGKIHIAGSSTLQSLLWGGDVTKIDGANIGTGTITANKLTVGLRNIDFPGVHFTPIKEANRVEWTSGFAVYGSDVAFSATSVPITAGSATFTGQLIYLYYDVNNRNIGATTDNTVSGWPNLVVLGQYGGADFLFVNYGRTVIDGNGIRANTINANRIQANTITARELSTDRLITNSAQIDRAVINATHIGNAQINSGHIREMSFDRLTGGLLKAGRLQISDTFEDRNAIVIEGNGGFRAIRYHDTNGITRVEIGQNRPAPNPNFDGLTVRGINGQVLLNANGFGVEIMGTESLVNNAISVMSSSGGDIHGFTTTKPCNVHVLVHIMAGVGNLGPASSNTAFVPTGVFYRIMVNGQLGATGSAEGIGVMGITDSVFVPLGVRANQVVVQGMRPDNQTWAAWSTVCNSGPFTVSMPCRIMTVEYRK